MTTKTTGTGSTGDCSARQDEPQKHTANDAAAPVVAATGAEAGDLDAAPMPYALWLDAVPNRDASAALPPAGLTVVQLGTPSEPYGHWPTAVLALVADLVSRGSPVAYVECGGFAAGASADVIRGHVETTKVRINLDEDLVVFTPPLAPDLSPAERFTGGFDVLGRRNYGCCIPTLHTIRPGLTELEAAHGPAVLVLDEVEYMRPYLNVSSDAGLTPNLTLNRQEADRWRATDLRTFAEQRSAPTVAVWHDSVPLITSLRVLVEASVMHVVVEWPDHGYVVHLHIARRDHHTHPWSPTRTLTLHLSDRRVDTGQFE